jgi:hypothetical protein
VNLLDERLPHGFWKRVSACPMSGCWLMTGRQHHRDGYAMYSHKRKNRAAHRIAYQVLVGPVPDGLQLDHLCRVRNCVNPSHLEPVTARVNTMRGVSFSAVNAAKTHCSRGHAYDEQNTYLWRGHRHCRACSVRRRSRSQTVTP